MTDRISRIINSIRPNYPRPTSATPDLTNFFNTLLQQSTPRLSVYKALLNPASANNELQAMQVAYPDVKKRLFQRRTALAYVHSTDPASQATQLPALDATTTTLFDATISDFNPLFQLDIVLAAQA
ncbi:hypothetical protein BJY52DRAFT_1192161 [Lactarius psammicola]|nr:hypothetical protein BJY52DRAFT_1192161 [Lactarius psammicola]